MTVLFLTCCFFLSFPQESSQRRAPSSSSQLLKNPHAGPAASSSVQLAGLCENIRDGIQNGSLESFAPSFEQNVFVNISTGEGGYVSSSQAISIIRSVFRERKSISFAFTLTDFSASTPYATGRWTYRRLGSQSSSQIYVSFVRQESGWKISQFNIY